MFSFRISNPPLSIQCHKKGVPQPRNKGYEQKWARKPRQIKDRQERYRRSYRSGLVLWQSSMRSQAWDSTGNWRDRTGWI